MQKHNKLEIYYNTKLLNFQVSCNSIQSILIDKKNQTLEKTITNNDYVVNATGSWAKDLYKSNVGFATSWVPPLHSYKRHLYNIEVSNQQQKTLQNAPVFWDETNDFYAKPEEANLLMSSCDETPTQADDFSIDADEKENFQQNLSTQMPHLANNTVLQERACLRTFCIDERPILGFDPYVNNLFWVAGLGGRGISISLGLIPQIRKYFQERQNQEFPFSCYRFI